MPAVSEGQPKPRTQNLRPHLTRLPEITLGRRLFRGFLRLLAKLLVHLLLRIEVHGLERFPSEGPALVVTNHLGDADVVVGLALFPRPVEALAKVELFDFPLLGWIMERYGVIWIHRGQPDRRAIRAALTCFEQGRLVGIAPEGRESLTGALEEGVDGAAFLALKGGVPIVPVTLTGTENHRIITNLKRLRCTPVTLTVGVPFTLEQGTPFRDAVRQGTETIMLSLAQQLPPVYRGVYAREVEHGS